MPEGGAAAGLRVPESKKGGKQEGNQPRRSEGDQDVKEGHKGDLLSCSNKDEIWPAQQLELERINA